MHRCLHQHRVTLVPPFVFRGAVDAVHLPATAETLRPVAWVISTFFQLLLLARSLTFDPPVSPSSHLRVQGGCSWNSGFPQRVRAPGGLARSEPPGCRGEQVVPPQPHRRVHSDVQDWSQRLRLFLSPDRPPYQAYREPHRAPAHQQEGLRVPEGAAHPSWSAL